MRSTCCGKHQTRRTRDLRCDTARHRPARTPVQAPPAWYDGQDRAGGRADHLHHHGLHHLRQSQHHGRRRHRPRRGVRRHVPGGRPRLLPDGPVRQLAGGPGAGNGTERLLHLHRGRHHGLQLADRPRRGVHLRGDVHAADLLPGPRMAAQQHPPQPQVRHGCGSRPVPRPDRPEDRRHRGGQPGDPDQARPPHLARPAAGGTVLPDDRRARVPPGVRRHPHQHPQRHPGRLGPRPGAVRRGVLGAAEPGADLPGDGHRRRVQRHHDQRDPGLPLRAHVRYRRHSHGRRPARTW